MENKKNNCGVSLDKDFLNAIDKKMDFINDEDIVYTYVCKTEDNTKSPLELGVNYQIIKCLVCELKIDSSWENYADNHINNIRVLIELYPLDSLPSWYDQNHYFEDFQEAADCNIFYTRDAAINYVHKTFK